MNFDSGNDPMLSSFILDDWSKIKSISSMAINNVSSLILPQQSSSAFIIPIECLLSPEQNVELPDMAALWSSGRKQVTSVQVDEDDSFSSYSTVDVDNGDIDMNEIDIGSNTVVSGIKSEIEDAEYEHVSVSSKYNHEYKFETNKFRLTEAEARRYVEEQFEKIAFVPTPNMTQREKIELILSKSDCNEFSVENILSFDKRNLESARACAKIVQNIPQRYRWECVVPEDIPCCYTIVADCKKISCRDKPPRPMNAFMIWAQGARRLINEICPKMQNALISEALGYYWRQKSDAFKQTFEQEKLKLRRFHSVEFPEYKYKPRTKVQKAKEKQELSLTKAKLRASAKKEKHRPDHDAHPRRSKTVGARPRTTASDSVREAEKSHRSHVRNSEKLVRNPHTKPDIKDMLTMKILNDRRCKESTQPAFKSQESVLSAFGQLSPLEVDRSGLGEILDDLGHPDSAVANVVYPDSDTSGKLVLSSVYDTPANTPPVEDEDDVIHSPVISQSVPHPTVAAAYSAQRASGGLSANNQLSIPPLLVPQISKSGSRSCSDVIKDQNLSILDLILRPAMASINKQTPAGPSGFSSPKEHLAGSPNSTVSEKLSARPKVACADKQSSNGLKALSIDNIQPTRPSTASSSTKMSAATKENALDYSDFFLTYVTDGLSSQLRQTDSLGAGYPSCGDSSATDVNNNNNNNNNNCDMNNNCLSDDNNNNSISLPASIISSKLSNSHNELGDLDTLFLDLNCPVLSDDDMKSILNSL